MLNLANKETQIPFHGLCLRHTDTAHTSIENTTIQKLRKRELRENRRHTFITFFISDIKSSLCSLWNCGIISVMEWSQLLFSVLAYKYCSAVRRTGVIDSFTGSCEVRIESPLHFCNLSSWEGL